MSDELVKAGTARALSLGWPDAYPSPRRSARRRSSSSGRARCRSPSCGRRSSSRRWPNPGRVGSGASAWRSRSSSRTPAGLLARVPRRARGHHRRHPGRPRRGGASSRSPHGGPSRDGRRCTTSPRACGTRCATGAWSSWSTGFFQRNPLYDDRGQPISVPEWSFPGRGRVQRQLRRADTAHDVRGKADHCLADPGQAGAVGRPHRGPPRHGQARPRLRRAVRRLHRDRRPLPGRQPARAVGRVATPTTTARFGFDPGVIDWDRYVLEIHLPSVLEHTRVRTKPGKSVVEKRPDRQRAAPSCRRTGIWPCSTSSTRSCPPTSSTPTPGWPAATSPPARRARFVADLVRQGPALLALDRRDRGDFLRSFYRRFEDAPSSSCARTRGSSSTASC